jgi:preprotein translocase subunit SecA
MARRWSEPEEQSVNMAAGEGKSWLFLVDAVLQAARPGVDAVQVITTRGNLADREYERYRELLSPLGIDVHRMNSHAPPPTPVAGRPTIYIGTSQDNGFTRLTTEKVPGQGDGIVRIDAAVDEMDEAFVHSNAQYILSEGVQGPAEEAVRQAVQQAADFIAASVKSGGLTAAHFGRAEGQEGGAAVLTAEGEVQAARLLRGPLTPDQLKRLNMAAAAHFEYTQNVHYVVDDTEPDQAQHKIYIIDQTTHEVMYDPQTATESRWNGGLAQAIEAKHSLTIRGDSSGSKSITARELYNQPVYGRVTGASGTAAGHGERFAAQGLPGQIADIPRYYSSRLVTEADNLSPDLGAKLDTIATDVHRHPPAAAHPGPPQRPRRAALRQADRPGRDPHRDRREMVPGPGQGPGDGVQERGRGGRAPGPGTCD